MQILRDARAMEHAIAHWPDGSMSALLARHLDFWSEQDDMDVSELANVVLVEPGDTLVDLDVVLDGLALSNPWSGQEYGSSGFQPCFETCEDHASFIDVVFTVGDDGFCFEVFIPKSDAIDPTILDLFQPHALAVTT